MEIKFEHNGYTYQAKMDANGYAKVAHVSANGALVPTHSLPIVVKAMELLKK